MKPSRPFDETRDKLLNDPKVATAFLEECLAMGDIKLFKTAQKQVSDARRGND